MCGRISTAAVVLVHPLRVAARMRRMLSLAYSWMRVVSDVIAAAGCVLAAAGLAGLRGSPRRCSDDRVADAAKSAPRAAAERAAQPRRTGDPVGGGPGGPSAAAGSPARRADRASPRRSRTPRNQAASPRRPRCITRRPRHRRRRARRSWPPERPRTPKCARSWRRCTRPNARVQKAQQRRLTAVPRGRVDRRQRHDPDPDGRARSRAEGDCGGERDRRLPLRVRRRPRLVRGQRLRLLGLGELCARGGRPAQRTGDLRRLESWGAPGPGRYITVYANAGHTYMYVDGMLYDTAGRSGVYASRWQVGAVDNSGYVARHYPGL